MKGLSSSIGEHIVLLVVLVFMSTMFVHKNILWRWDNLVYDAQLSLWERETSNNIIIVAIDDESLNKEGRWPWPRSKHADLINKIMLESPKVIGLDIIFSEPDLNNPASDASLSLAMASSRKVVLPLYMTQENRLSYPIEALPLPQFTEHAAALGHVHIDISPDGIARRIFLKEGIDVPQWLHYGLAVLSVTDFNVSVESVSSDADSYSSMRWSKQNPYLIPFAGTTGHFQQIGYSQVMSGAYPEDLFRNKIVLVGTTATGLGDSYPTPMSGDEGKMPGVEIIANVIDAVQNNITIRQINDNSLILLAVILVTLPLLLYSILNPARAFVALILVITATVGFAQLLLIILGVWIPLSTILLFQFISYPLWSWRRLSLAMHHINNELNKLSVMQHSLRIHRVSNVFDEMSFIAKILPVSGWVIIDDENTVVVKDGDYPELTRRQLNLGSWLNLGDSYWAYTQYKNQQYKIGLRIKEGIFLSKKEKRCLNKLMVASTQVKKQFLNNDVLEAKINALQIAGGEYQELRKIVDDSLSGMSDGVIICDGTGQIMLSNQRASWYLYSNDNTDINAKSIINVFNSISLPANKTWAELYQSVLFEDKRVHVETRHEDGRDLLIAMSPLRHIANSFVVTLSDVSLLKSSERKRNEVLNFLSHDLRSPLNSILAMIEIADGKNDINEMHEMLSGMKNNTNKTLRLAEQFLQLSRANTTEKLNFQELDVNTVVLNAIDQLWATANKKNITIDHLFEHESIWTYGEPELLERAILNLLDNAVKHSNEGDVIKASVDMIYNQIICCVTDKGTGIGQEELPHLFEMFRRTRDSGEQRKKGIGLGLAFVHAVAKRHSGKVEVESILGSGTTFCICFPKSNT